MICTKSNVPEPGAITSRRSCISDKSLNRSLVFYSFFSFIYIWVCWSKVFYSSNRLFLSVYILHSNTVISIVNSRDPIQPRQMMLTLHKHLVYPSRLQLGSCTFAFVFLSGFVFCFGILLLVPPSFPELVRILHLIVSPAIVVLVQFVLLSICISFRGNCLGNSSLTATVTNGLRMNAFITSIRSPCRFRGLDEQDSLSG